MTHNVPPNYDPNLPMGADLVAMGVEEVKYNEELCENSLECYEHCE